MNEFIKNNSGFASVLFVGLLSLMLWSFQQGIEDYTNAVKNNTCAVNALTMKVEKWVLMTVEIGKDLDYQTSHSREQDVIIADHEIRIGELEGNVKPNGKGF